MHEVAEERARAEAAAAERDRLLGEVHDSLTQRLVSIRVYLDAAERDASSMQAPPRPPGTPWPRPGSRCWAWPPRR